MYDRILLPTDGSETADHAVEEAIDAAKRHNAAFHVLFVVDQTAPVLNVRGSDAPLDQLEAEGKEVVDRTKEQVNQAAIESVTGSVCRGEPAQTILDYANTNDIDLVVMGTHGRSGLDRHLLGSVAEKVVRHSDSSVLTVRGTKSRA